MKTKLVFLLLFAPLVAWAQEGGPKLATRYGESFTAGGGVQNFVADQTRSATDVGGYWDVRGTFGTRSPLGIEAAYIGAAQNVRALGLDSSAILARNGLEANARINLPVELADSRLLLTPFVFGGVGWSHYTLTNKSFNTSSMKESADAVVLPVGLGLSFGYRHFIMDGRFTYRAQYEDDLMTGSTKNATLENWSTGMLFGYEF
jgi:hypothetical protein